MRGAGVEVTANTSWGATVNRAAFAYIACMVLQYKRLMAMVKDDLFVGLASVQAATTGVFRAMFEVRWAWSYSHAAIAWHLTDCCVTET